MTQEPKTTPDVLQGLSVRRANDSQFGVMIALYGPAGSGKTTLAAAAADSAYGAPLLVIDAEGGTRAIAHRDDIDVIDVRSWKEIDQITQRIKKAGVENFPYKTVVMDNLSEYTTLLVTDVAGSDTDQVTQPEWQKVKLQFLSFVRTWREFARQGLNVIMVAWENEQQDELGRVKHNLAFIPSLRREFPGIIDIIGYLTVVDRSENYSRVLDFSPSTKTESKFRRSQSESAQKIPFQIVYGLENVPMADILSVLKGGEDWPTNKYTEAQQQRRNTQRS